MRSLLQLAVCITIAAARAPAESDPPRADAGTAQQTPESERPDRILVLYSYSSHLGYTRGQQRGIIEALGGAAHPAGTIYEEFLHEDAPDGAAFEDELVALLNARYRHASIGVIIAADTPAVAFLARRRAEFLPDVPIVVSAPSTLPETFDRPDANVTGVLESLSVSETCDMMMAMQPGVDHLIVITDDHPRFGAINSRVSAVLSARDGITYDWFGSQTIEKIVARVSGAAPNEAVLYIHLPSTDSYVSWRERSAAVRRIFDASIQPIYALYSANLHSGAAAGVVADAERYGRTAGQVARSILNGTKPSEIPLLRNGVNAPTVNVRALKHWGIPLSRVPQGTVLLSAEQSWISRNRDWAFAVGGIGIGLFGINGLLLVNRRRLKRIAVALQRSEEQQRLIFDASTAAMIIADDAGRYLRVNDAACALFGVDRATLLRDSLGAGFSGDDEQGARLRFANFVELGRDQGEIEFLDQRGERRVASYVATRLPNGEHLSILHDLTEMRRAQAERDRLFASCPDMLCIASFDGRFIHLSPAWQTTLGWSITDLSSRPWLDFVHPDDVNATIQAGELLVAGQQVRSFRNRYRCTDGSYRVLSWNAVPDMQARLIYAMARDVTELGRQRRILEQTSHDAKIGGWEYDVERQELFWSEETYRIHETSPDRYSPAVDSAIGFYSPECRQTVTEAFERCLKYSTPFDLELEIVAAKGRRLWVRATGRAESVDGHITTVCGTFQDIQARKQAELALRESEQRHRMLVDALPVGILVHDGRRIHFANNHAVTLLGASDASEIEAKSICDFSTPEDREILAARCRGVLDEARETPARDCIMIRLDGKRIPIEIRCRPILVSGQRFIQSTLVDLTERRRAEEAIRESEERFRIATGVVSDAIWDYDIASDKVLWSEGLTRNFGHSLEVNPTPFAFCTERIHPHDRERIVQGIRDAIESGGSTWRDEYRFLHGHGHYADVQDSARIMRDSSGAAIRIIGAMTDMTDDHRAKAALLERERFVERIAQTAPSILYVYDVVEHRNVYVNDQIIHVLGYTPDEIKSLGDLVLTKLMHPDDLAKWPEHFRRLIEAGEGEVIALEYRLRDSSGNWHWLSVREMILDRGPDGMIRQIIGTALDITEWKHALESLRLSEMRYRLALRAAKDSIWDWDILTDSITRGDAAPTTPTSRHSWIDAIHPEDRPRVLEGISCAIDGSASTWSDEYRHRNASGRYAHIADRGYIIRDAAGRAVRMIGAASDISERKEFELRLAESEERLRQITENAREVFWVCGWDPRILEYISPSFREVWGKDPAALADGPGVFERSLHPDDAEIFAAAVARMARGYDVEYRILRADGEVRWIHDRAYPIRNSRGEVYRIAGIAEDITQARRNRDDLRRTNQVLQLLLAELDHRVKNALAGLITMIEQTSHGISSVPEFAATIRSRVAAMLSIHSMLSESHWKPISLRRVLHTLIPNHALGRFIVEGPETFVAARQATAFAMVMQELMTNSLKYGAAREQGGEVHLRWTIDPREGSTLLRFEWQERGGPPVPADVKQGLGIRLVDGFSRFELAGRAEYSFAPEGVHHRFAFMLDGGGNTEENGSPSVQEALASIAAVGADARG